ncbi:Mitochondrial import inner membrane translocase subunit tim44 [Neolecta irregularis DAH-3]|uniref:Mitochondrial import inner membrane translocase subunit TIM44 n=1 Tax=Neolecta irregularis (strain DAH-3) TaxID=1198029 RepID=A0A1U7LRK5_NEOID|nr:Mitochondrial import inner membrane translocase subunit tim44 [Neolecta irregularis DAH-3]|eukprot:OLL25213.1 Mitochondrial import inner membrane translocase subunit tim44 [Neolecta irregularis DAH-3]
MHPIRRTFAAAAACKHKSPARVFVDTFKAELRKSKELQHTIKALQDESGRLGDSDALRKAKDAYSKARDTSASATSFSSHQLKKAGRAVGSTASAAWHSPPVKHSRNALSATGSAVASAVDKSTAPIRNTQTFKAVSGEIRQVIDDGSSSRYGGFVERDERRRRRIERDLKDLPSRKRRVDENPEAGHNVVLHKDSAWKESWNEWKDKNPMMQSLFSFQKSYKDSENPLVSTARDVADRLADFWAGVFKETETASVVKKFKQMDPNFTVDSFTRDLRDYILPEIVDAYVKGDAEILKIWLGEAPFQVWSALAKQYTAQGLVPDGCILDIRGVDIVKSNFIPPSDIPVFVVTFRTQEVHVYRSTSTGEIMAGVEDNIQQVSIPLDFSNLGHLCCRIHPHRRRNRK